MAQTNLIIAAGIGLIVAATLLIAPASSRADTMYVVYAGSNTVEKFDTLSGVGTVFATNGLNNPQGLAFDTAGNLYVDNYSSNTIEKFDTNGNGSVFANTGLSALGMVVDKAGNLFVANWENNNIEKFDTNGNGTVFADGSSGLDAPIGLIFDSAGFLYVANWENSTIVKLGANGNGTVFASSGLNGPQGMAFDSAGNLYVANSGGWSQENPGSGSIEKFDTNGVGSVFASSLYFPCGLAFDSAGNLYAASRGNSNNLIYKFTSAGVESIFANTPGAAPEFMVIRPPAVSDTMYVVYAGSNTVEKFDTLSGVGTVFATNGLNNPQGLAFDTAGNLYVDNYSSNTIEKFDTNGNGSVFANTGLSALGMVVDKAGNLFVANWENNNIEKFDTNGNGTVFADGSSGLDAPIGLIFDSAGFLYVANWENSTIVKLGANGNGTVFASSGLNGPQGMAFDSAGNLYVANSGGWSQENPGSGSIEKFDTNGVGSVFASSLYFPCGLAFDSAGNLYAASRGNSNNLIYKFTPAGVESIFANTPGAAPEFMVILAGPGSGPIPPSITSQPQPTTVTKGNNATFTVVSSGTQPFNYQWSFNSTNILGATASSLTISNVAQTNLGTYAVVVANAAGSVTSSNAMLSMHPYIYTPFTGVVIDWGQNATLSVQAWGTGPLSYQWFDNGAAVPNATNQTLTLASIQFISAGLYSVVVTSPLGSVTNTPEQVVVNPAGVSLGLYPGVTVTGTVGYTYNIQATSDLSNPNGWTTMATLTLQEPVQLWIDTTANTMLNTIPHRYYRVVPGP